MALQRGSVADTTSQSTKDSEDVPKEVSSTNRKRCSGKIPRDSTGELERKTIQTEKPPDIEVKKFW